MRVGWQPCVIHVRVRHYMFTEELEEFSAIGGLQLVVRSENCAVKIPPNRHTEPEIWISRAKLHAQTTGTDMGLLADLLVEGFEPRIDRGWSKSGSQGPIPVKMCGFEQF
jgi:hypothetical protein